MTLGAPSVQAITQSTLNARLTSCTNELHRLITCCMTKISCQQLTLRSNGEKNSRKTNVICFPRKERGGREGTRFSVLSRDLPRRGERHGSLLTDLVGQSTLMKVAALEVMNRPKAFKEESWGVCAVAGAQKVFT